MLFHPSVRPPFCLFTLSRLNLQVLLVFVSSVIMLQNMQRTGDLGPEAGEFACCSIVSAARGVTVGRGWSSCTADAASGRGPGFGVCETLSAGVVSGGCELGEDWSSGALILAGRGKMGVPA